MFKVILFRVTVDVPVPVSDVLPVPVKVRLHTLVAGLKFSVVLGPFTVKLPAMLRVWVLAEPADDTLKVAPGETKVFPVTVMACPKPLFFSWRVPLVTVRLPFRLSVRAALLSIKVLPAPCVIQFPLTVKLASGSVMLFPVVLAKVRLL